MTRRMSSPSLEDRHVFLLEKRDRGPQDLPPLFPPRRTTHLQIVPQLSLPLSLPSTFPRCLTSIRLSSSTSNTTRFENHKCLLIRNRHYIPPMLHFLPHPHLRMGATEDQGLGVLRARRWGRCITASWGTSRANQYRTLRLLLEWSRHPCVTIDRLHRVTICPIEGKRVAMLPPPRLSTNGSSKPEHALSGPVHAITHQPHHLTFRGRTPAR